MCGQSVMDWEVFSNVVMDLKYSGITAEFLSPQADSASGNVVEMQRERARYSWNRAYYQDHQPKRLFRLLLSTSSAQCSDPRDKIYGILGLAVDIEKDDPTGFWAPDYGENNTLVDVFKRFAVWNLQKNTTLECLSYATERSQENEALLGLPSWAPDWTSRLGNEHPFVRYSDRIPFRAHDGSLQDVFWIGSPTSPYEKLSIMAKPVDTVQEMSGLSTFRRLPLGSNSQNLLDVASGSKGWLVQCRKFFSDTVSINSNGSQTSYNTEFWELMTCGLSGEGYGAPDTFSEDFEHYVNFLDHITKNDAEKGPDIGILGMRISNGDSIAHIESSLSMWASRRRLARTEQNRLCWLPSFARPGDIVCIVPGCKVPYVFRPLEDGHFTVVGEAYVDGMMFAEVKIKTEKELREIKIV